MPKELFWKFEPNPADRPDGLDRGGSATFRGRSIRSLARETIQNSLDASDGSGRPVEVRFSIVAETDFDRAGLLATYESCLSSDELNPNQREVLERGRNLLGSSKPIPSLAISDHNTVGLGDGRMRYLVKGDGASPKPETQSLGNRGLGKNSAIVNSGLRTVLYSTLFEESGGSMVRMLQGKASLVSHTDTLGEKRGATGYYGIGNWDPYSESVGPQSLIPEAFRRTEIGTTVIVVDFRPDRGWERELLSSVLDSFYFAVASGRLQVTVDDGKRWKRELDQSSIHRIFDELARDSQDESEISEASTVYNDLLHSEGGGGASAEPSRSEFEGLGRAQTWLRPVEDMVRRIDIVREPGMVVCNAVGKLTGLKRLPSHVKGFVGIVVFESEETNLFLKRMEPPEHDTFQIDWLDDEQERKHARSALDELGRGLRQMIEESIALPPPLHTENATELVDFVADLDEPGGQGGEDNPFAPITISRYSRNIPVPRQRDFATWADDDTDGEFPERSGKRSRSSRRRRVKPSKRGRARAVRRGNDIPLRDARLLIHGQGVEGISFVPERSGLAKLDFRIASEERTQDVPISCEAYDEDGERVDLEAFELEAEEPVKLLLSCQPTIPAGCALMVVATEVKSSENAD